jgi:hypothetical protein
VSDTLEELERTLEESEDADEALREAVALVARRPGVVFAAVAFNDGGSLALGPSAGTPDEHVRARVPVVFQGETVGELWVDGEADRALLERVAERLAAHVLIGWDTGGDAWEP